MILRRYTIEIRGGTGAGKSTLIRALMHGAVNLSVDEHLWIGLVHGTRVAIPGSYAMPTGGLENRYSLEQCIGLLQRARLAAPCVVFEGGMLSKTTGEVYRWLRELGAAYRVVYLRPPMGLVFRQMSQRRAHGLSSRAKERIRQDHELVDRAVTRIIADGKLVVQHRSYAETEKYVRKLIKEVSV